MPSEPSLYTNSQIDLEEKARRETEEERRRIAREEAKFKEHMEKRKLAMVDAILAEEGGTPLLDSGTHSRYIYSLPLSSPSSSCCICFLILLYLSGHEEVILCMEHLDPRCTRQGASRCRRQRHQQPRILQGPGRSRKETS